MILLLLITLSLAPLAAVMVILRGRFGVSGTANGNRPPSGQMLALTSSQARPARSEGQNKLTEARDGLAVPGTTRTFFTSPAHEQRVRREILTKILTKGTNIK